MKNRTLLLAVAFLFAVTPMIAANPATEKSSSNYSDPKYYCGVTYDEVYQYMLSYGFHVTSIIQMGESTDLYVTTAEKRNFIVHTEGGQIIGVQDPEF